MDHPLVQIRPGFESVPHGQTALDTIGNLVPGARHDFFPFKRYVGVADTTILLRDLKYTVKKGKLTNLMHSARGGSLYLYATHTVRQEILEKISTLASVMGWEPALASTIWHEHYEPWIRFLDTRKMPPATPEVAATFHLDPDDGPTAQLASLINPDFIFSDNYAHLMGYELLGDDWVCVAVACREMSEYQLVLVQTSSAAALVCGATFLAIEQFVDVISGLDKRWLMALGCIIAFVLLLPASRRWITQGGPRLLTRTVNAAKAVGAPMHNILITKYTAATAASHLLEGKRRLPHQPRQLRDFVTAALARATAPMSVDELLAKVTGEGYQPRGAGSSRYLESRVLRAYPQLFREITYGRWQLATLNRPKLMPPV